jgi:hypothetical protein
MEVTVAAKTSLGPAELGSKLTTHFQTALQTLQDEIGLLLGDGIVSNGLLHGRFHSRLHILMQFGRGGIGQQIA